MRQLTLLAGILLAAVGLIAAAVVATAAPVPQSSPRLDVVVGQGEGVVQMLGFVPDQLRVAEGTTITWTVGGDEEHTVAFLADTQGPLTRAIPQPEDPGRPTMANPLVWDAVPPQGAYDGSYLINSGVLGRGQSFSVTFSKAGTFPFLCTLHEAVMRGSLEVVPAGTPGITSQAEVDGEVASHMAREHNWQVERMLATRSRAVAIDGPGDSNTHFVRAGTSWRNDHMALEAFLPDSVTVRQGDTVVWAIDNNAPHTVTFLAPGQPPLEQFGVMLSDGTLIEPGVVPADPTATPRIIMINRAAVLPAPSYDGRSFYHSGQIGGDPPSPRGIAWSMTFDAPGTYEYFCLLHAATGMRGQVTVTPRT